MLSTSLLQEQLRCLSVHFADGDDVAPDLDDHDHDEAAVQALPGGEAAARLRRAHRQLPAEGPRAQLQRPGEAIPQGRLAGIPLRKSLKYLL